MAMNNFNDLIKMKNLLMLMSAVLLILGGCSGNGASKDAGDDLVIIKDEDEFKSVLIKFRKKFLEI